MCFILQHLERWICFSFWYLYYPHRLQILLDACQVFHCHSLPTPHHPRKCSQTGHKWTNRLHSGFIFWSLSYYLSPNSRHNWPLTLFLLPHTPQISFDLPSAFCFSVSFANSCLCPHLIATFPGVFCLPPHPRSYLTLLHEWPYPPPWLLPQPICWSFPNLGVSS